MTRQLMPPKCLVLLFLALLFNATASSAQNVPLKALDNWMWYDERGWVDLERGRFDRAEQEFNMAIKEIKSYPPANRKLMAKSYCDLARVLYHQKRYAEAQPLAEWALTVRDSDKKPNSDAIFQCLFTLGSIHAAQNHFVEAEPLFKRALTLQEKELTGSHVNTLMTLDRLALVLRNAGKFREAEPLYLRAIAIHQRTNSDENLDLADTEEQYCILLRRMNRKEDAEIWQARALAIRDTVATRAARDRIDRVSPRLQGFK